METLVIVSIIFAFGHISGAHSERDGTPFVKKSEQVSASKEK